MHKCIPLIFHIDGAEVYKNCEFHVWSWRSAFAAHDDVMDTQQYLLSVPHQLMRDKSVRDRVHDQVAKYIAWNLEIMQRGIAPTVGFYGEEFPRTSVAGRLAGSSIGFGWTATFFGWHGDQKSRRDTHRFQHHYNKTWICDECFAVQHFKNSPKHLLFQDFRPDALHKLTRFADLGYRRAFALNLSPWAIVPGWSLNLTLKDLMHVLFLGCARDHCASHIVVWLESGLLKHLALGVPASSASPKDRS